jgi:excisionase family DNA binding protein
MMQEGVRIMSSALDNADELGAMTVREFCDRYRIGHTLAYEIIKRGELRAVKCGSRTLILARDARAWERSLPAIAAG